SNCGSELVFAYSIELVVYFVVFLRYDSGVFILCFFFFFKQKTAYEIGLGIPAEPLFRSGIKSAIQGSNVPNPDEAVPSFVSGAMAKAGKGLLEGTLQAGTSAVSDKLLDLVGLGGKSAADKGKDT